MKCAINFHNRLSFVDIACVQYVDSVSSIFTLRAVTVFKVTDIGEYGEVLFDINISVIGLHH